jgi:hypothetical protein
MVFPLNRGTSLHAFGPVADEQIQALCNELKVFMFGADQISDSDPYLPARIWTPLLGVPRFKYQPDDSWSMIAFVAKSAGDETYGSLAKNLSISLRAAGVRLRDASDQYHLQLKAALLNGQKPGLRFSNVPLTDDLHLAFHSLLAELSSARDYLAALAGQGIGAPQKVDALNRLLDWISKPTNSHAFGDPLISALLDDNDKRKSQSWLTEIGEYRNLFLHRRPLSSDEEARWLRLREYDAGWGPVTTVEMRLSANSDTHQQYEALERFVELYRKMCRLAGFAADIAKYTPEPLAISAKDILPGAAA